MPFELQKAIDSLIDRYDLKNLQSAQNQITSDYRTGRSSKNIFKDPSQLLAYLIARMPATYAACLKVFLEIRKRLPHFECKSIFDLGAGPGTASWAALEAFPLLSNLHLLEREVEVIEVGKKLSTENSFHAWENAEWKRACFEDSFEVPSVDLAVLSYAFGEMAEKTRLVLIERLWKEGIPLIAVIEPGTPEGFERIRQLREYVLSLGACLIAPCPHSFVCPKVSPDWCHFPARVERSRLHKQIKGGTLGFEDEKYTYLVFGRSEHKAFLQSSRILGPPQKGKGHVRLTVCSSEGNICHKTITRSDRECYRAARDAEWGSTL